MSRFPAAVAPVNTPDPWRDYQAEARELQRMEQARRSDWKLRTTWHIRHEQQRQEALAAEKRKAEGVKANRY
jgi:hypothetical protein